MTGRRFLSQDLFLEPTTVSDGTDTNFDARGLAKISVIAGSGATVTWSRVDSFTATGHGAGNRVVTPPPAGGLVTLDVDWPYYRISSSGGDSVVSLV